MEKAYECGVSCDCRGFCVDKDFSKSIADTAEAKAVSFESWFTSYHDEACENFGGIDCTNPKGIAEDAWNAAIAAIAKDAWNAAIAAIPAPSVADAQDAVRYRWLKVNAHIELLMDPNPVAFFECDERIDAAIAKEKNE